MGSIVFVGLLDSFSRAPCLSGTTTCNQSAKPNVMVSGPPSVELGVLGGWTGSNIDLVLDVIVSAGTMGCRLDTSVLCVHLCKCGSHLLYGKIVLGSSYSSQGSTTLRPVYIRSPSTDSGREPAARMGLAGSPPSGTLIAERSH